jgi:hypothetical protein
MRLRGKGRGFMNLFKKIGRSLSVLAMAPLVELEKKERERRLEERLKRCEEKQKLKEL